ncbi:hypothetical protein HY008_03335 [Candidatus Woesebacteria bacterium]|nr:hypothetical protein [Candidatus Woesebacteria bacterium]
MRNLTSPNIRLLTSPLLTLLILIVLSIVASRVLFEKITDLRVKLDELRQEETGIQEKLSILESERSIVGPFSDRILTVFPSKNPSLIVISQLKNQASRMNLEISEIKVGSESERQNGIFAANISFVMEGESPIILNFLKNISKNAPITKIDKVQIGISDLGNLPTATVLLSSFWSPLPQTIPNISQRVDQLTTEDKSILNSISNLNLPPFSELPPSASAFSRPDPFSY